MSPSKVEAFTRCELRWFLEHVGGTEAASSGQNIGLLVHAVAATAGAEGGASEAELLRRFEELAAAADLGRGWSARRSREQAEEMVRRLARWLAGNPRTLVGTELAFDTMTGRARLHGRVDRLEVDADGRAVVIDLKTSSAKAVEEDLPEHPQLGAYQLAVTAGAFGDEVPRRPGGAELVQLGKGCLSGEARPQRQKPLDGAPDPTWAEQLVLRVAEGMAGAAFRAMDNKQCHSCPARTSCPVQDDGRQVSP
ncbi:MAG: PD-(D/E)XK nuclease family protein [Actinomycetota bacterium]|nr:PD-(D/E)XK nuclease family protein [Actinomycetota bacterium]